MKKNILVIGNGAFGIAISQILLDNDHNVFMFSKNVEAGEKLKRGYHSLFPDVKLKTPTNVYSDYNEAFKNNIDMIVLCVPSISINDIFVQIKPYLKNNMIVINTAKGLNPVDSSMWSTLFMKDNLVREYCLIVGPSFASEIVQKNRTIINIVCKDKVVAQEVENVFNNNYFKLIYFGDEYIASLVSSFKNSLALGLGISNSLVESVNTQSAYLIIGINEIQKILSKLTNSEEIKLLDFFGIGDIYLTCTSDESRNYQFGFMIGKVGFKKATNQLDQQTIEGYRTLKLINDYIEKFNLSCPLFKCLYQICYEDKDPSTFSDEIWNNINY